MADRGYSLLFVLMLLFLILHSGFGQLSSIEQSALFALRSSLGLRGKDWPRKVDPCKVWVGIQCLPNGGGVIGINISGLKRTRLGRLNPNFSVDALANLTLLTSFNASGFSLPGPIPNWFGSSLKSLQLLDLRACSVTGSIPFSLGNLGNLNLLYVSGNNLTGVIPSTLGQLSRLSVLDLSQNSLTGMIPSSFSSLNNLTVLDLSSNSLFGPIPSYLGTLTNLQILNLSNNNLSSSIPTQLGDLSGLVDLDLGFNSLSGSLPMGLNGLRNLQKMVIGDNALTGSLPNNMFSSFTQLKLLVLRKNSLSGSLPDSLWSMPKLLFLDVSLNNFSGVLPSVSSNVNASTATFNLSHNQFYGTLDSQFRRFGFIDLAKNYLEGKVPLDALRNFSLSSNCLQNVSNQRTLEDCRGFYAARGLIFDNFGLPNTTEPPVPGKARKSNRRLKLILAGVFGSLGLVLVLVALLVFCICVRRRAIADQRGRGIGPAPVTAEGSSLPAGVAVNYQNLGEAFTHEQLVKAAGDFGDLNLIKNGHSGDLFRGVLENGSPVVIKRIDMRSSKKDSYMLELELFSKASHTRLISLLGHCLEHQDEKLLVYKYMPNGDLSNSLFRKSSKEDDDTLQSLDWITRLKIAIGAAEALSYLHHECSPPLVHRDVQASSILLDDKYEVRLGSLSEVCIQEGNAHQNVVSRLLRFPQSSNQAPTSSPSVTCAYDVYCFGKILLELVTGKLGLSAPNDSTTTEWLEQILPCISIYERDLVTKIVDPSLIVDEDLLEEVWAMAIVARSCLNPKPSKRPLMRYILKALENPLKVVREDTNSGRLASSRESWNASIFGSWRHSSSDIVAISRSQKEGGSSSFKQSFRVMGPQGSARYGGGDITTWNRKQSSDIFPEPVDFPATERPVQE